MSKLFITLIAITMIGVLSCKDESKQNKNSAEQNNSSPEKSGKANYNKAIHPGNPEEGIPFWNQNAIRYIYAPSFDIQKTEGAASYRFTLTSKEARGESWSFEAKEPWADLSPVWAEIPVINIRLEIIALGKKGNQIESIATKFFYRSSGYNGPYREAKIPYGESAFRALEYYFNWSMFKGWLKGEGLDPNFGRSAYPSKTIGATVKSMLMYAELTEDTEKAEEAIQIAKAAADELIKLSESKGAPLEYFPPTYIVIDEMKGLHAEYNTAKHRENVIMMNYPAYVALRILDLYDKTADEKYFEYARRIADTYIKVMGDDGTWPVLINTQSLEPLKPNRNIPTRQLLFFERLVEQYGLEDYREAHDKTLNWIMENPVKNWCWEGQFEDIGIGLPYTNLSKTQACEFVEYLAKNSTEHPEYIAIAEEITAYVEDQFVVWENAIQKKKNLNGEEAKNNAWLLPCALEQYVYYTAIDHSAASVMNAWLNMYDVTGKEIYLEMAEEMGKTCTHAQAEDGRYPTYWIDKMKDSDKDDWINCAAFAAEMMLYLDRLIEEKKN